MSLFRRFLSFLRRGFFGSKSETEEFIRRIQRGDVEYIINVGVPTIEAPELPEPRPWKLDIVAEGFMLGSNLLVDPEALMYILMATERSGEPIIVRGAGVELLRSVASYTRERPGKVYYFDGVHEGVEVRVLAANGLVTGLYLEAPTWKASGVQAITRLGEMSFDALSVWATPVREKLLEWSDEKLSVYVRGLDNQHKYLINTLNSLYRATTIGEGDKVLSTILRRLVDYTKFHFRSEEILMERYNYPVEKLERHQREHQAFVKATVSFREKYERGEATLGVEVFKFLATWVANHVAGTDRDYGLYFKKIGVANYEPGSSG